MNIHEIVVIASFQICDGKYEYFNRLGNVLYKTDSELKV